MHRLLRHAISALLIARPLSSALHAQVPQRVSIDAHASATPSPHFWERIFSSGHAILSLREAYRDDIRSVHKVADFRYVCFHSILDDEVSIYNKDEHGNVLPKYAATVSPVDPTPTQVIQQLDKETALGTLDQTRLHDRRLTLELSPNVLLLIKVQL